MGLKVSEKAIKKIVFNKIRIMEDKYFIEVLISNEIRRVRENGIR